MDNIPKLVLGVVSSFALFAAILFWPAGRLDWIAGWVYLAVLAVSFGANLGYLSRVNPELIEHRMHFGAGTKSWDIIWAVVFGPLFFAVYAVGSWDAGRYDWPHGPGWYLPVGLILHALGMWLFSWAMGVNPFFEKTVRIQTERQHRVVDSGPYRWVRHPGYLGFFGWIFAAPLLLGSNWAFVPAAASALAMIVRTALEDSTLMAELPGYREYAARTRFRLIPGIW